MAEALVLFPPEEDNFKVLSRPQEEIKESEEHSEEHSEEQSQGMGGMSLWEI